MICIFSQMQLLKPLKRLGVRSNIGLVVLDFPTNYATDPEDYLLKGFEFRDKWRNEELITTSIAPHAPYSVSDEAFTLINTYSEELNIKYSYTFT